MNKCLGVSSSIIFFLLVIEMIQMSSYAVAQPSKQAQAIMMAMCVVDKTYITFINSPKGREGGVQLGQGERTLIYVSPVFPNPTNKV